MASGKRRIKGPKADIRSRILDFLKSRGQAGIDDVACQFRIRGEGRPAGPGFRLESD